MTTVGDAYSLGADAWADGPIRIYSRLADLLLRCSPWPLDGRLVLDLGAGTGAASRPAVAAGARVIAIDLALGMLQTDRAGRPPGAVADIVALPWRAGAFDTVIAAFSLNHLADPADGTRELRRVLRDGGILLASTYAVDDDHPVKHAVERALEERGWEMPAWYPEIKSGTQAWGTETAAAAAVTAAALEPLTIERRHITFPDLHADALVRWRLGMAQCAEFVGDLAAAERDALASRALDLLGPEPPPLVRSVILTVARAS